MGPPPLLCPCPRGETACSGGLTGGPRAEPSSTGTADALPPQHPRVTCHGPSATLLGLPIKVWSHGVVGTAPALLKKGAKLPKPQQFLQEQPTGGGHSQSQALLILHNQMIWKTRVSLLAPQGLPPSFCCGSTLTTPLAAFILPHPHLKPSAMLKASQIAKASPKVWRQLMAWGLLGQLQAGKDAQKSQWAGAGTVAVGRVPTVLSYLGPYCSRHPRKSSGSVHHWRSLSPANP